MKVAAVGLAMAVLLVVSAFAGHIVDADFDVPGGGYLRIQATGFDHSTWHPGAIGQQNTFEGWGGFGGTYDSYDGSFGALSTYVNAAANPGGADLNLYDQQEFDILGANTSHHTTGYFYAHAWGIDTDTTMNMKVVGSMYVASEATNPYSAYCLRGQWIEKEWQVWKAGELAPEGYIYYGINTDGVAEMHNSNIWGWGVNDEGKVYTNYGGGTRTADATGTGALSFDLFGQDNANATIAVVMPGGGWSGYDLFGRPAFFFNNGIQSTYQMDAQ